MFFIFLKCGLPMILHWNGVGLASGFSSLLLAWSLLQLAQPVTLTQQFEQTWSAVCNLTRHALALSETSGAHRESGTHEHKLIHAKTRDLPKSEWQKWCRMYWYVMVCIGNRSAKQGKESKCAIPRQRFANRFLPAPRQSFQCDHLSSRILKTLLHMDAFKKCLRKSAPLTLLYPQKTTQNVKHINLQ